MVYLLKCSTLVCKKDSFSSTKVVYTPIHLCPIGSGQNLCEFLCFECILFGRRAPPWMTFSGPTEQIPNPGRSTEAC